MYKLQFKNDPSRGIWLVGKQITLGSSEKNDVILDSLGIDDFHASIDVNADELTLACQPGRCYVNELPVDENHHLRANDEIKIGSNTLLVVNSSDFAKQLETQRDCSHQEKRKSDTIKKQESCWLLIPAHKQLKGQSYSIELEGTIGRGLSCGISIPHKLLSRNHAKISVVDGQLRISDLDSVNGTFHNGKRVKEVVLSDGDTISFSNLDFSVKAPIKIPVEKKISANLDSNKTMIRSAFDVKRQLSLTRNKENPEPIPISSWSNNNQITSQNHSAIHRYAKLSVHDRFVQVAVVTALVYSSLFALVLLAV